MYALHGHGVALPCTQHITLVAQEVHQRLDAVQGLVQKEADRPPLIIRQTAPLDNSGGAYTCSHPPRGTINALGRGVAMHMHCTCPTQALASNTYG